MSVVRKRQTALLRAWTTPIPNALLPLAPAFQGPGTGEVSVKSRMVCQRGRAGGVSLYRVDRFRRLA